MDENYYIITQEEADKMKAIIRFMFNETKLVPDQLRSYAKALDHLHSTMTDCPAKRGDTI